MNISPWQFPGQQAGAADPRLRLKERSPNDPDTGNPQGARGFIAWLLLIFLLGVLPAGVLIYWGYFAPLTASCNTQSLGSGQICEYSYWVISHHYTYAQAISYEMFRQWVDRVIGPIWALLALGFVAARVRQNAIEQAPVLPERGGMPPSESGAAYQRERIVSALTIVGIVICALGVLALIVVPPEVF